MRKELNNIETIEKYLKNELYAADKKVFEEQLKTDTQLQKEVELQREVVKGIERIGAKQSIQKSYKKYKLGKTGFNLGLGSLIVLSVAAVFMWYTNTNNSTNTNQLPEFNELGTTEWADADRYLEPQKFTINTANDTVIETEEGIVMYIPKGSFLDENGNEISDEVEFEVKEAMNTEQILRAGLSTKSGNRDLETGGMFYINARKDGKSVKINPEKGIYTEVPTNEVKANMQLFEGKRMADGTIDWVNPAPLEKFLTPVDIQSLNFYPPKYEAKLTELGIDASNKNRAYKDSLYFSFACMRTSPMPAEEIIEEVNDSVMIEFNPPNVEETSNLQFGVRSSELYAQEWSEAVVEEAAAEELESPCRGIDPAKIQAIWNNDFANTLIATREFEERLKVIFTTCNNDVLDLYVNNMNLNLFELDEKAAQLTSGEQQKAFLKFAARKDGRVKVDGERVEKLKKHYEEKQRIYAEAVAKTEQAFREKNRKANQQAQAKRSEQTTTDIKRKQDNFAKELEINLDEAYRQIGKKRLPPPPPGSYKSTITNAGWNNLDRYVIESTTNRETLDYTDPETGKKAIIKYEPISVSIKDVEQYDRVLVYFIPDKLNSFMRMKKEGAVYTEKLNELMKNDVICLAYKGEQAYYKIKTNVKPKAYENLKLDKISHEELKQKMRRFDEKQTSSLFKEFDYQLFEQEEKTRINNLKLREEFRAKIEEVIFPCGEEVEEDLLIGTWEWVKTGPGKNGEMHFIEAHIRYIFKQKKFLFEYIDDETVKIHGTWKREGDYIFIEEGVSPNDQEGRFNNGGKLRIKSLTKNELIIYSGTEDGREQFAYLKRIKDGGTE